MNPELYVLIEGNDDKRFFTHILKPLFEQTYRKVHIVRYAQDPLKKRKKLIKSFSDLNTDYVYVTDIDNKPCVTAKKDKVLEELDHILDSEQIIVVRMEIESWYLAGINDVTRNKLKISALTSTNTITKEQFLRLKPKGMPKIVFMLQILRGYQLSIAKNRNQSLKYILNEWYNHKKNLFENTNN